MQMVPCRPLAPAAVIVVLAALAGCANGGSSGAVAGKAATVAASAVASISAKPSTSAKPSAAASTSAKPSSGASTVSAPTPTAVASTPRGEQTASALLDSALSAMQAQQSVHMACTSSSSAGSDVDTIDVSVASGRIASNDGDFSITNMLVGGIAYVSTDNAGVWESEGIPQAEAEKLAAGEWLSIGPGQSYGNKYLYYAEASADLTVADQADLLRLSGPLERTGATTAQGVPVYGVSGQVPSSRGQDGAQTVYIAATGTPLPVSETIHSSSGTGTCDYSGWDEPLNLTAPSNVLPISAIPK